MNDKDDAPIATYVRRESITLRLQQMVEEEYSSARDFRETGGSQLAAKHEARAEAFLEAIDWVMAMPATIDIPDPWYRDGGEVKVAQE